MDTKSFKSLPLTLAQGIWLVINEKIFEGKDTLSFKCAYQSMKILSSFPRFSYVLHCEWISKLNINKEIPWYFFDKASQGAPLNGGVG
jgi:hypothetical protein